MKEVCWWYHCHASHGSTVMAHQSLSKALSLVKTKTETFGLSEPDFTNSQSSKAVWFYTLCPGRSTPWTERLQTDVSTNP